MKEPAKFISSSLDGIVCSISLNDLLNVVRTGFNVNFSDFMPGFAKVAKITKVDMISVI